MSDDTLTAALDEIRERYRRGDPAGFAAVLARTHGAPQDVPRLLAAVEAALAEHLMQPGYLPPSCETCSAWDEEAEEMVYAIWPCPTYQAISRALLGDTDA